MVTQATIRGRRRGRAVTRALACCLALCLALSAAEAQRARPRLQRPKGGQGPRRVFKGPNRPHPAAPVERLAEAGPEAERAREIIRLYLRSGREQPYLGEQTTRLLEGRVQESQQSVKHAGPGRERIEYLSPPALRGDILLLNGGRLFKYVARENKILDGPAPLEEFQSRARELIQGVRQGRITVRAVGTQIIAGQSAAIVEIHAGGSGKRFWIDEKTGVRLKSEDLNAQGTPIRTSYFTRIDYTATFAPREFLPHSLPNAPHEPLFPQTAPLPNVQAAQQQVAYTIREPSVPAGFRLNGVWVGGGKRMVILRYTDGVSTFALFQNPRPPRAAFAPEKWPRRMLSRNGVTHWFAADRVFTLIGSLNPEGVRQIVESLR